jgi:hypothetical protein
MTGNEGLAIGFAIGWFGCGLLTSIFVWIYCREADEG